MIVFPPDRTVDAAILDRALLFAGDDQGDLHLPWLDSPGVCAVPEEAIYYVQVNGAADRLRRACDVYPDSTWCAVRMIGRAEALSDRSIVTDVPADFDEHVDSNGSMTSLHREYNGGSILLFSMEYPAAVLFSAYEFTLVTGSEEFVGAYYDHDLAGALSKFNRDWAAETSILDESRPASFREGSRRVYRMIWSQVRVPLGVEVPQNLDELLTAQQSSGESEGA